MFVNRLKELEILEKYWKNEFIAIWGRRRLGKSSMLRRFCSDKKAAYSQCIRASTQLQWEQIIADLQAFLPISEPRVTTWDGFFSLLNLVQADLLCLDEFPYLVEADSSTSSRFQDWLDSKIRPDLAVILCGSSQKMMLEAIIEGSAPLYGRAIRTIRLSPMGYDGFCEFWQLDKADTASFSKYSLVGGVPLFWRMTDMKQPLLNVCQQLYFDEGAPLAREADRVLADEDVTGPRALSVLQLIGRGASKPAEISNRLGVPQTGLTRALQQLHAADLITKEMPYGISHRKSKSSRYIIQDPFLLFHYGVFSVHQSRWRHYDTKQKQKLIHDHAAQIFELEVRKSYGGQRYWDKQNIELDVVIEAQPVQILEIKFHQLKEAARTQIKQDLIRRIHSSQLKFAADSFEVGVVGTEILSNL